MAFAIENIIVPTMQIIINNQKLFIAIKAPIIANIIAPIATIVVLRSCFSSSVLFEL